MPERLVYAASYGVFYIAWNAVLKHAWRLVGQPMVHAIEDVVDESNLEDFLSIAKSRVSPEVANKLFLQALYNSALATIRRDRAAAASSPRYT